MAHNKDMERGRSLQAKRLYTTRKARQETQPSPLQLTSSHPLSSICKRTRQTKVDAMSPTSNTGKSKGDKQFPRGSSRCRHSVERHAYVREHGAVERWRSTRRGLRIRFRVGPKFWASTLDRARLQPRRRAR
jgi:hypothetical protein